LLPLAEFTYNNAQSASIGMSPFFANYGYHPRATLRVRTTETGTHDNPGAETLVERLRRVHAELRSALEQVQKAYKRSYDRRTQPAPPFKPGDLVWLNRKNINTTRPSQKFDTKRLGPFRVVKAVGDSKAAFELELPSQWRIHPVFHVSLLDPYRPNSIEERRQATPRPLEILDGDLEYEVSEVLDSKIARGKLLYLVDWKGYSPEERTWEPAENVTHASEAVATYHSRYPNRPSTKDIPTLGPRRSSARKEGSTVTDGVATGRNRNHMGATWGTAPAQGARRGYMDHGEATWIMARPHGPGQGCREHGGDSWTRSQSQVGVGGTEAGPQGI